MSLPNCLPCTAFLGRIPAECTFIHLFIHSSYHSFTHSLYLLAVILMKYFGLIKAFTTGNEFHAVVYGKDLLVSDRTIILQV